jgi:hypothetical protein
MLKPVELDRREDDEEAGRDAYFSPAGVPKTHEKHEKHPSSAILEIEAGSGLYSTPGTRRLDNLTTPAGCIQMISDPEHLPTITLIKQLCMEHGKFIAFVPRHLKSILHERLIEGAWRQEENQLIEEQRSLLRTFLSKIGVMHPNLEPSEMPDDWDLTTKLTGGDENCAPFFASIWSLVNAGALKIVGKTGQGVILEPTEKLFNFSGSLEEDSARAEDQANNEYPDSEQAIA